VHARLDAAGITKVRSNRIRAVEHMLTASPEWFQAASPERVREWVDRSMDFLRTRYGNNLVSAHLHMDETSPQIHAVMVPITPDGRLSKTYYFDRPQQLRQLHSDYHQAVQDLGLERGTERSKAEHKDIRRTITTWGYRAARREAARQVTIARYERARPEERLAAATCPSSCRGTDSLHSTGKPGHTDAAATRRGKRAHERARTPSYDQYRDMAQRVRDTDLTDVLGALGGKRDQYDRSKWHVEGYELSVRGQKYADMHVTKGTPMPAAEEL
jgi:hypothetical protein